MIKTDNKVAINKVGVVGLGYVGLPLAVQFASRYEVIGFDINESRIAELARGIDVTREVSAEQLNSAESRIRFTSNTNDLTECELIIVAVPTPITANNEPDLRLLEGACRTVGKAIRTGATVVFESTVYPGCTEEICVPIVENESGLVMNSGFFVGYSPERMNPGDRDHTLDKIVKITSGSSPEASDLVDRAYAAVIKAGTYRVSSIRVAEAAKVIENTQRDLNIAFVNELAKIFNRMGIDTKEVLDAAGTKWNFLPFKPGLVGGHCIGVDPYYLTFRAQEVGYHPEIILAGRRLNDSMGTYIASEFVKLMIRKEVVVSHSRVLVLGITFKDNCPDIRNSRVPSVIRELAEYGCEVSVYDPWADATEVQEEYGINLLSSLDGIDRFDGCVLAVSHREFVEMNPRDYITEQGAVYDVKSVWPLDRIDQRL